MNKELTRMNGMVSWRYYIHGWRSMAGMHILTDWMWFQH